MKRALGITGLSLALLTAGCIPNTPTKTIRPAFKYTTWEERTITSEESGEQYRYLFAAGPSKEAPAILLLPGGIFDHRIWLYTVSLSEHFNVYALDWPDTSRFYRGNAQDYADICDDFLRAVGLEELFVAGISAGGYAVVELIATKKQYDFKAAFLISSIVMSSDEREVARRTRMSGTALRFKPDRLRALVERRAGRAEFDHAPGKVQQRDIFYVRPYSYYKQLFSMAKNQGNKQPPLEKIDCPVLMLHGTEDEVFDYRIAKRSAGLFSDAEWVSLEGYKHSMLFSHGPQIVDYMLTFLEKRNLLP